MSKSTVPAALFPKQPPRQSAVTQGPKCERQFVTPEMAERWLAQNTHNRNVRTNRVLAYARDMEAGDWAENGEAIKFASDGTLLDGQHRLLAITIARVGVWMHVFTGLPHRAQETMDDGAKRTLADILTLRGEENSVILAAVTRRALIWDSGVVRIKTPNGPTNAECLAFLEKHAELRDSAKLGSVLRKPTRITSAVLGFTHWLFSGIDGQDAAWFFEHLGSGAGLEQYHPVWTLRKRFAEEWQAQTRLPEDIAIAYLIKGWNAFRDGEDIKILRYKPGGAQPEKFPMPK